MELAAGVVDGELPLTAGSLGGGVLQLEKMRDQALDLAEGNIRRSAAA